MKIKYTNCWEDVMLLEENLQVGPEDSVCSIASGGDNSLFLLTNNPKEMICVDHNPTQLYLTQLKATAIRHLNQPETLQLLGFRKGNRMQVYKKLETCLQPAANQFWKNNQQLIKKGIIYCGKFERYLQLFSKWVLPFIHSDKKIKKLLLPKSGNEQEQFYKTVWNSKRWRLFFRFFFGKEVLQLGRDRDKFSEVEVAVGTQLLQRADNHFISVECQDNFMLSYILTGSYSPHLPPYMKKENFERIKNWLISNEINYVQGTIEEAVTVHSNCNKFNLSNIFEYLPKEKYQLVVKQLFNQSANNSWFCFWNLFVERNFDHLRNANRKQQITERDLGFFYKQFYTYRKRSC